MRWYDRLAAVLVAGAFGVAVIVVVATGQDTNDTVRLQRATVERAVCVSEIYSTWYQAIGDVVLTAAQGRDPRPRQVARLDNAQDDLAIINQLCPPPDTG